jgi:predicted MFS family arabinose efflux permease
MPFAGRLAARLGSAGAARLAATFFVPSFLLPIVAPGFSTLLAALFVFGATSGLLDVAMNAHGVLVERRLGRPIMSSLHAAWSLGGLTGSALGGLALAHFAPPVEAALTVAVLGLLVGATQGWLLPAEDRCADAGPAFALPGRGTIAIGCLAFASFVAEGAMLDWTAVFLTGTLGAGPAFAATGYAAFSGAMTCGRLAGDRVRARLGAVAIVRLGGALAALGLGFGVFSGSAVGAIAGFALAGFGLSNLVPVFFGAGGRAAEGSGRGIAAVATLGYLGLLIGPPAIGGLADAIGLAAALGVVAAGLTLVVAAAGAVRVADR